MGLFYVHIPKSLGMKKKKLPKALGMKKMSKSPKTKRLLEARAKHRKFLILIKNFLISEKKVRIVQYFVIHL